VESFEEKEFTKHLLMLQEVRYMQKVFVLFVDKHRNISLKEIQLLDSMAFLSFEHEQETT